MCVPRNWGPLCCFGPKITSPIFMGLLLEKRGSESEKSKINFGDTPLYT
jgi:hypothetical protein